MMAGYAPAEVIELVEADWDESGFYLSVGTDEDDYRFSVRQVEIARRLLSQVSKLRTWIEEHDREKAAYDRASPVERARVLGRSEGGNGAKKWWPTQPCCYACWLIRNPDVKPARVSEERRMEETCVFCGVLNRSGIYVQVDELHATYPTLARE